MRNNNTIVQLDRTVLGSPTTWNDHGDAGVWVPTGGFFTVRTETDSLVSDLLFRQLKRRFCWGEQLSGDGSRTLAAASFIRSFVIR